MTNKDKSLELGDPRLIRLWTRRYARSRTIPFLVQWVFIVVMVGTIGSTALFTNEAYRKGETGAAFYLAVAAMGLAIVALMWFSASRKGGEVVWNITSWVYRREGYVEYAGDRSASPTPAWVMALGGGLVIYHLVGALLVSFNHLSLQQMQPFSAVYMTPFLIVMIISQRLGWWAYVWPALYALHAACLYFDIPVGFPPRWQLMHMVVAVLGYGLLAILAGHLYSRFALHMLKRVAQSGLPRDAGDEETETTGGESA